MRCLKKKVSAEKGRKEEAGKGWVEGEKGERGISGVEGKRMEIRGYVSLTFEIIIQRNNLFLHSDYLLLHHQLFVIRI